MGRTRVDRAIALLEKKKQTCKSNKKRLLDHVENIKNKCLRGEID